MVAQEVKVGMLFTVSPEMKVEALDRVTLEKKV